jgi:hypothetical protein
MNAFPHQQRADRGCDQARTLRSRHGVLVQVAGMAYDVLPSVRSRTMRATTSSGVDLGLPSVTPFSFLICRSVAPPGAIRNKTRAERSLARDLCIRLRDERKQDHLVAMADLG